MHGDPGIAFLLLVSVGINAEIGVDRVQATDCYRSPGPSVF